MSNYGTTGSIVYTNYVSTSQIGVISDNTAKSDSLSSIMKNSTIVYAYDINICDDINSDLIEAK